MIFEFTFRYDWTKWLHKSLEASDPAIMQNLLLGGKINDYLAFCQLFIIPSGSKETKRQADLNLHWKKIQNFSKNGFGKVPYFVQQNLFSNIDGNLAIIKEKQFLKKKSTL